MKLVSITWSSELPLLLQAARDLGLNLEAWSYTQLEDPLELERCLASLKRSRMTLIHPSADPCWDEIIPSLDPEIPVISFSRDPSHWAVSSVPTEVTIMVNRYVLFGGPENFKNMLKYACNEVLGTVFDPKPPEELIWQGLYHPKAKSAFYA